MRRTTVTLLLTALLMAAGLVVASPASACSCYPQTTQQFLDGADAVFTGRLLSSERAEPPGPISSSADPVVHVFAVDAVVKGTVHERQEVLSPISGATCGLELAGDGPFVVFATRSADLGGGQQFTTLEDDQYAAFLCGGTTPVAPALETELRSLAGAPTEPLTVPTTTPTTRPTAEPTAVPSADPAPAASGRASTGSSLSGGWIGAAVLLLVAGIAVLIRRRRSAGSPRS